MYQLIRASRNLSAGPTCFQDKLAEHGIVRSMASSEALAK